MTEMKIGRGRIHPELDPERAAEGKLGRKLGWRNNLDGAAGKRRSLFLRLIFVHVPLSQFHSPELQWFPSVQEY